ncbi:MAG: NUDIX hydrolase [Verrucomicrobia bacterium]|nr:NUDIX hydrolase [Verrucomicrobiota bacterium]MDA1069725.1 NUDIX hydrolase [Verrucomicrobiota bacterium]
MHRNPLKELLRQYRDCSPSNEVAKAFTEFVNTHANCFERSQEEGHVTASAWIVDPKQKQVLLIHHKKLGLWLQPGGHCDGDPNVVRVAKKEVREETGLKDFRIFSEEIFDLDIHKIPQWKTVPAHYHYDVRFLIYANSQQPIAMSGESNALRWFDFSGISEMTPDASVIRMAGKVRLKLRD